MTFNDKYRIFYILILLSVPLSIAVAAEISWWYLLFSFVWYRIVISRIFVQIGLHRYFSHKNFKTGKWRHQFLAIGSVLTGHGSIIAWVSHHTHHHIHSDDSMDVHSPRDGWWNATFFWAIRGPEYFTKRRVSIPKHLLRDKLVIWLHNNYFMLWILGIIVTGLISWKLALFGLIAPAGWSMLFGNIVSNLLSHIKLPGSYQNFFTDDDSQNSLIVQLINPGEGLHNNHHYDSSKYNHAMAPGEFDPSGWIVKKFFDVNAKS